MGILRFTDGEEFDTSGPLRKEERYDGWYIIGENTLIPIESEDAADSFISYIITKKKKENEEDDTHRQ